MCCWYAWADQKYFISHQGIPSILRIVWNIMQQDSEASDYRKLITTWKVKQRSSQSSSAQSVSTANSWTIGGRRFRCTHQPANQACWVAYHWEANASMDMKTSNSSSTLAVLAGTIKTLRLSLSKSTRTECWRSRPTNWDSSLGCRNRLGSQAHKRTKCLMLSWFGCSSR